MRNTSKSGTSILFFSKKEISMEFVRKHKTQTGYINVSCPELTAVDLVENEKSVGGLNRVCTVLNELAETMNLDSLDDSCHTGLSTSGLYSGTCIGKSGFGGNLIFQNGGCRIKIQKDTV